MAHAQYLYAAIVFILLIEIVAGRHRGIYDRESLLVTFECLVASIITRPLAALMVAFLAAFCLPDWKGVLTGVSLWWISATFHTR